jgi:LysR family nitrogen assimilation transcriptional regulator
METPRSGFPDLIALSCFVSVAELGSLLKASRALGYSTPMISKRLGALEADFGERLFHRTGRGMSMTELGRDMLPQAREVLAAAGRLERIALDRQSSPSGVVRVGLIPAFSFLAVELFLRVRASSPRVRIVFDEAMTSALERGLDSGQFDVAVVAMHGTPEHPPSKSREYAGSSPTYLAGVDVDGRSGLEPVSFSQLDGIPLALPEETGQMRRTLESVAQSLGIRLNVVVEANSTRLLADLVAKGRVYSLMSLSSVPPWATGSQIVLRRIVDPEIRRYIGVRFGTHRPVTRAVRQVAGLLREMLDARLR